MKGQTGAYLAKARGLLDNADAVELAGRTAYLAGFHAAQALIFETNGRIFKTHSGVNGEFSRLVKDDARVDDQIRAFLGRTFNLKAIADYLTGPGAHISPDMAREAVDSAHRFVECLTGLMPTPDLSFADRFGTPPAHEPDASSEPDNR